MKKILVLISMFTLVAFLSTTTVSAQKVTQKVTTEKTTTDKTVAKDDTKADKAASCTKSCAKACAGEVRKSCAGKEDAKTETETAPVPKK